MDDNIRKIFLSRDANNNIFGLTIVRNNSVKHYGFGKNNYNKLISEYIKVINELKEKNKEIIQGLQNQEIVNKFYQIGIINYVKKDIIKNINVINENTRDEKIIIEYSNGISNINLKDFKNIDDYNYIKKERIKELCNIYEIPYNESTINILKELELYNVRKNKKKLKQILLDSKVKNFVLNKKFLSGILASAVSFSLGAMLHNKIETIDKKKDITTTVDLYDNKKFKTSGVNQTITSTPTVSPTFVSMSTIEPIDYFKEISFENENILFNNYVEPEIGITLKDKSQKYSKKNNIIELLKIRRKDILNILNHPNENIKVQDKGCNIYFENLVNLDNLSEKAFIKYFSMIGNQLINSYNSNNFSDKNGVNKYVTFSYQEILRLIRDNKPLVVYIKGKKKNIFYNSLSCDVKKIVLDIAFNNSLASKNQEIEYNDKVYNSYFITNYVLEQLNPQNMLSMYCDSREGLNYSKYESALSEWKDNINEFIELYKKDISNSSELEIKDDDNNHEKNKSDDVYLLTDLQKNKIITSYLSDIDPYKSRFSQGIKGYGNVKYENSTIRKSGCGICAFASGVSCALTSEYGKNISINPEILLNLLKKSYPNHSYHNSGGLSWGNISTQLSIDITGVFKDISIIELVGKTPTFNKDTLEAITLSGYTIVESLAGRGHLVCITKNDGKGNFYVADSDRGYSEPITFDTAIKRTSDGKAGKISAKKAWIFIPNNKIEIINNEFKIKGLDFSILPSIGKFETNGKAYDITLNYKNNSFSFDGIEKELSLIESIKK